METTVPCVVFTKKDEADIEGALFTLWKRCYEWEKQKMTRMLVCVRIRIKKLGLYTQKYLLSDGFWQIKGEVCSRLVDYYAKAIDPDELISVGMDAHFEKCNW